MLTIKRFIAIKNQNVGALCPSNSLKKKQNVNPTQVSRCYCLLELVSIWHNYAELEERD